MSQNSQQADERQSRQITDAVELYMRRALENHQDAIRFQVNQQLTSFKQEMTDIVETAVAGFGSKVDAFAAMSLQQQQQQQQDETPIMIGSIPKPKNKNALVGTVEILIGTRWNKNVDGSIRTPLEKKRIWHRLSKMTKHIAINTEARWYHGGDRNWGSCDNTIKLGMIHQLEESASRILNVHLAECEDSWGANAMLSKKHQNLSRPKKNKASATVSVMPATPTPTTTIATTASAISIPLATASTFGSMSTSIDHGFVDVNEPPSPIRIERSPSPGVQCTGSRPAVTLTFPGASSTRKELYCFLVISMKKLLQKCLLLLH
ncbi:unnamed protein product [Absidia cylindrospora]